MVDAAYGNDQLKGICEGDSLPSTRTSNPGPGSNVKSSFKSKNSNSNSQKCDFSKISVSATDEKRDRKGETGETTDGSKSEKY